MRSGSIQYLSLGRRTRAQVLQMRLRREIRNQRWCRAQALQTRGEEARVAQILAQKTETREGKVKEMLV